MSRVTLILTNLETRRKAAAWCMNAPMNARFELKEPKRTIPQNDRLWAALTDVSRQLPWHGVKLSAEDWKLIFLASLKQEMRLVPNIDGTGFVNLGRSSSDLTREEFSLLLALIEAFAAEHEVTLHDPAFTAARDLASPNKRAREAAV